MDKEINREIILYVIGIIILVAIAIGQLYLFYFASCSTVKSFWLVTQMPARCINL